MPAFDITPSGPFDLVKAAGFGFGPRAGAEEPTEPRMSLAFVLDDLTTSVGVELTQADGVVHGEVEGSDDADAVSRQVARILSLDGDGAAFCALGDPVLRGLQQTHPGLRPVLFHSPYEAAAWSVISARRPTAQAAGTRRAVSEALGASFATGHAFPVPERLLTLEPMKGLPDVKVERLHGIARAALEGKLEAAELVAMDQEAALAHLQSLPGIGPFYAMLILIRGSGAHDLLPADEPRTRAAAAHFYARDELSPDEFRALADAWRPFRTWAAVLLQYSGRRAGVV